MSALDGSMKPKMSGGHNNGTLRPFNSSSNSNRSDSNNSNSNSNGAVYDSSGGLGHKLAKYGVTFACSLGAVALINLLARLGPGQLPDIADGFAVGPTHYEDEVVSEEYVLIDKAYLRWLWWPLILYLFWGMAFVCDDYFVRTIDVISEKFDIPDDVAGATLMALGCNGPELALNMISVCHPSNIGIGAVVGGEVFNVLVIIGTALLATPAEYMPLELGSSAFFRDVIFYVLSVVLLYAILRDNIVTLGETLILLCGAGLYTLCVVYSGHFKIFILEGPRTYFERWRNSEVESPKNSTPRRKWSEDSAGNPDARFRDAWISALASTEPTEGSILTVRMDVQGRMYRGGRAEDRYVWLRDDALLVSTVLEPKGHSAKRRSRNEDSIAVVYDHDQHVHGHHYHLGGLVNVPFFFSEQEASPRMEIDVEDGYSNSAADPLLKPLINDSSRRKTSGDRAEELPPVLGYPKFCDAPWEIIPLEDVLYCESDPEQNHFNLLIHKHDSNLGTLTTLEWASRKPEVTERWAEEIRSALKEQRRKTMIADDAARHEKPWTWHVSEFLRQWVEWFQFPIRILVSHTVPDMNNPKSEHLWMLAFTMSMAWLAIFAYAVVQACDGIHDDFGISTSVLGFTVAAAGTSFPNVFSGMCVARQGKTPMAISNALGANVQNVFLALAVPWVLRCLLSPTGDIRITEPELFPAVMACLITLFPVVAVYVLSNGSLPRWAGFLFLWMYVVYMVYNLGAQATHCPIWPVPC